MTQIIHRIRTLVASVVRPPSPSLLDAVFGGVHADQATPTADHSPAAESGSRIGRLSSPRRDLAAALRADPAAPEDELTTWPPSPGPRGVCQGC